VSDDVGNWTTVDCEQQRPEHRPLRDTNVDFDQYSLSTLLRAGGCICLGN